MTYKYPFNNLGKLRISHDGETIELLQHKKFMANDDLDPFSPLMGYLDSVDYKVTNKLWGYYKRWSNYILRTSKTTEIIDFDTRCFTDILDLIKLEDVTNYFATRLNVPSRFKLMWEESIGKDRIRTYTHGDYIEFVALVATYSAVVPILAMLVSFKEPETGDYAMTIAMAYIMEHPLFSETEAGIKFNEHVKLIYKTLPREYITLETEFSPSEYQNLLKVISLSKLLRYDYMTDTNAMNFTTKFNKSISDKTSTLNEKKKSANVEDKSSAFELNKSVYLYTRAVKEENMFITEDPNIFKNQYGTLSDEHNELFWIAMDSINEEFILTDSALSLTNFVVREYIHPSALELLDENRLGVETKIMGGLKHCLALAFAFTYPVNKILAAIIVSDKLDTDFLTPKTNTSNVKTVDINRVFPFVETVGINYIGEAIKKMGDELLTSTLQVYLPKHIYEDDIITVPSDIKVQILDLYDYLLTNPSIDGLVSNKVL